MVFQLNVIYLQGIKARWDWGKASWIHMDAASTGTGPLMWGIFLRCQELCSPFTFPHPGLFCQESSDGTRWQCVGPNPSPANPVYCLCLKTRCSRAEMAPVPILSPQVNGSGVTARAGQFLCSQHLGAAGALPKSWHCSETATLMFSYIIYRGNSQGQGQGRCYRQKNLLDLSSPTAQPHSIRVSRGWEFMSRTREQPGQAALPGWENLQGSVCSPGEQ